MEDDTRAEEQVGHSVEVVIDELAAIDVTVLKHHLAFVALIVDPDTLEARAIAPGHDSVAIALTRLEVAAVLCLFILRGRSWEAVVVFHDSRAISSAVLEHATELVAVFVVYLGETEYKRLG